jgi:hypothetical protein
MRAHGPILQNEFAVVGFGGRRSALDGVDTSKPIEITPELLKEKTAQEFSTYATGRQNVAFMDIKLSLFKRYNPVTLVLEYIMSFFFESIRPPTERMEATIYAFDGKEKDLVPRPSQAESDALTKGNPSSYDQFVWAIVNKDIMKGLRDDRYDISLTVTKDHPKLPSWATIMSESAEVTDVLLTESLIKAVEEAGDASFEHLIVTDQPVDKPQKYPLPSPPLPPH